MPTACMRGAHPQVNRPWTSWQVRRLQCIPYHLATWTKRKRRMSKKQCDSPHFKQPKVSENPFRKLPISGLAELVPCGSTPVITNHQWFPKHCFLVPLMEEYLSFWTQCGDSKAILTFCAEHNTIVRIPVGFLLVSDQEFRWWLLFSLKSFGQRSQLSLSRWCLHIMFIGSFMYKETSSSSCAYVHAHTYSKQ